MKKKELKGLDLNVYFDKLKNGLEIYIVPFNNVNNTYATYSTRYGGIHNEFVPNNGTKMVSVPKGIAHFLEHKMFEQEDGSDVFNFFSERGSDANANTNVRKTTYLFSGPNSFYENLEFLLDYVEKPYFTDENVEKEKGIITQEIKMYQDKPFSRMYEGILYNTFINHPMKYPVIGTIDSVNSITKENLYDCYNTFYHPSNMFVVVTGNVNPKEVMKVITDHEEKRNLTSNKKIKLQKYKEPDMVEKKEETIYMDVTIPKTSITYKIRISHIRDIDYNQVYSDIMNAIDLKLSTTSLFNERLRNEGLIAGSIDITGLKVDDHILAIIDAESKNPEKVIELIQEELKDLSINEEELERRKRTGISDLVLTSDNVFRTNNKLMADLIALGSIDYDSVGTIKNTTIKEVKSVLTRISLDNYTIFTVKPFSQEK